VQELSYLQTTGAVDDSISRFCRNLDCVADEVARETLMREF